MYIYIHTHTCLFLGLDDTDLSSFCRTHFVQRPISAVTVNWFTDLDQ